MKTSFEKFSSLTGGPSGFCHLNEGQRSRDTIPLKFNTPHHIQSRDNACVLCELFDMRWSLVATRSNVPDLTMALYSTENCRQKVYKIREIRT